MPDIVRILLVEDSLADSRLIQEVLKEAKITIRMELVRDGEEALKCLRNQPPYEDAARPDLIILDLNLPKKDGREVLAELKDDPQLQSIPVVILTTSQAEEDILRSYKLNASCYVTKPIDLDQFVKIIRSIDEFWFTAVKFPRSK
ncbi:MAG TPA: response regulator [Chroococcales cyanobacterium]